MVDGRAAAHLSLHRRISEVASVWSLSAMLITASTPLAFLSDLSYAAIDVLFSLRFLFCYMSATGHLSLRRAISAVGLGLRDERNRYGLRNWSG